MHPRIGLMGAMRAQQSLSVYLTILRNPGISTQEVLDAFGWVKRTFQRRVSAARSAGLHLRSEEERDGLGHRWYSNGLLFIGTRKEPVLERWVRLMKAGSIDLTNNPDKIQWYREQTKLMLVGTPPFSPTDYATADIRERVLHFNVPTGRSINHHEIRAMRDPSHV